jgi:conjugative transposon TraJ protein
MRKRIFMLAGMLMPIVLFAQETSWADDLKSMHSILELIQEEMLPMCSNLINVGRGIAGFAALWYIAERIWQHMARAESIDFYPLMKPVGVGLAILLFPSVIALMNGVLHPMVSGTAAMVEKSDATIALLLEKKKQAMKDSPFFDMYVGEDGSGNREKWYQYTHPSESPDDEGWMESIGNDFKFAMAKMHYTFRLGLKQVIAEILEFLYAAISLAINTLRTFRLVILAILGPLAFGISIFNGFGHTLRQWIARYINIFLWLPVANIFGAVLGKIQEQMLKTDLAQIDEYGDTFFSRLDMGYMIFLLIGIIGYLSVPSIANEIVWVGGNEALTKKTTGMVENTAKSVQKGIGL